MATRSYTWRTASSGTEGTTTVFVDSYIGNDEQGLGTRIAPYKTLTKAWTAKQTKPTKIVCRGLFSEQMTTGNHSAALAGDYYGAAIFDGQDKYLVYGFTIEKMIILNASSDANVPVHTGTVAFRGVGRANDASLVGYANRASGLASSPALVGKSGLYWGIIGGNTANKDIVYWKPVVRDDTYLLSIGSQYNPCLQGCTVYDAGLDSEGNPTLMMKSPCSGGYYNINATIFAKTAIVLNTPIKLNYNECLFASDCKYYYFVGSNATSEYIEISLDGVDKENRGQYLLDRLSEIYSEKKISTGQQYMPKFTNTIFSDQSSEELFNNPEQCDMTLIPNCDADIVDEKKYIGALPPAKNIPIRDDSTGIKEAWDERSASGCVIVSDNKIWIDPNSSSNVGSILSKIITINPREIQLNAIYSIMPSKWGKYLVGSNEGNAVYFPTEITTDGAALTGLFLVKEGSVTIGDLTYNEGEAFTANGQSVTGRGVVVEVLEPNAGDVLYCRCRSAIYKIVEAGATLTKGATYLNISGGDATYHGRTIADSESFVCMVAGEVAHCKLGVMFDEEGVPSSEWVPARFWDEYFVCKENGSIKYDAYGIPYSSANNRSYSQGTLYKSTLDRKFIQFKIEVTKL